MGKCKINLLKSIQSILRSISLCVLTSITNRFYFYYPSESLDLPGPEVRFPNSFNLTFHYSTSRLVLRDVFCDLPIVQDC